jgi:hypothetical protein
LPQICISQCQTVAPFRTSANLPNASLPSPTAAHHSREHSWLATMDELDVDPEASAIAPLAEMTVCRIAVCTVSRQRHDANS